MLFHMGNIPLFFFSQDCINDAEYGIPLVSKWTQLRSTKVSVPHEVNFSQIRDEASSNILPLILTWKNCSKMHYLNVAFQKVFPWYLGSPSCSDLLFFSEFISTSLNCSTLSYSSSFWLLKLKYELL